MAPPLSQDGYGSTVGAPYIHRGYTSLSHGFDQDATLQMAVTKLHFDGMPNQDM